MVSTQYTGRTSARMSNWMRKVRHCKMVLKVDILHLLGTGLLGHQFLETSLTASRRVVKQSWFCRMPTLEVTGANWRWPLLSRRF